VAFGFAGAVEVWAILPVLVVAVLLVIQAVHRAARFVAGVAIGFLVPVERSEYAGAQGRRFAQVCR